MNSQATTDGERALLLRRTVGLLDEIGQDFIVFEAGDSAFNFGFSSGERAVLVTQAPHKFGLLVANLDKTGLAVDALWMKQQHKEIAGKQFFPPGGWKTEGTICAGAFFGPVPDQTVPGLQRIREHILTELGEKAAEDKYDPEKHITRKDILSEYDIANPTVRSWELGGRLHRVCTVPETGAVAYARDEVAAVVEERRSRGKAPLTDAARELVEAWLDSNENMIRDICRKEWRKLSSEPERQAAEAVFGEMLTEAWPSFSGDERKRGAWVATIAKRAQARVIAEKVNERERKKKEKAAEEAKGNLK